MRNTLFAIAVACLAVKAQSRNSGPTFEAASIKTATRLGPLGKRFEISGGPGTSDPGRYDCRNCSLYLVVSAAYNVSPYQFSAPDWLEDARFDFSAKIPPGTGKAAFREMLQNLLAERFHLIVHREQKEMLLYDLSLLKNGPKFREGIPKDEAALEESSQPLKRDAEGYPILPPGTTMAIVPGHARLRSDNRPISWLAEMLSNQLGRPVVDATGLKATYDFVLSWVLEPPGGSEASQLTGPTLLEAVQSQLGLKLDQKKGAAEVLVVSSMDKVPTAN